MKALEITTILGCSIMCDYCPQGLLISSFKKNQKKLSVENFKIILDKLPQGIAIHFTGFSEPFFNDKCFEMIDLCKEQKRYIKISTTLYKANEKNLNTIIDKKFNKVILHLPANNNDMRIIIDNAYVDNVQRVLKCLTPIDSVVVFGNQIDRRLEDAIKTTKAKINYLKKDFSNWNSRAGNLKYEPIDLTMFKSIKCSKNKIEQNILLPNGDVYLCCMDWGLKHKIGNLLTDEYQDIINSSEYKFIIDSLNNNKSNTLCWRCDHAVPNV